MCGILFALRPSNSSQAEAASFNTLWRKLENAHAHRGPDAQQTYETKLQHLAGGGLSLRFFGSELRLRGYAPVVQPHIRDGNVLCWNGEVFEGLDMTESDNDGMKLFDRLLSFETPHDIVDLLGSIEGPYAILYYHASTKCLWFARDPLGRRSLLVHKPTLENPGLMLMSVSTGSDTAHDLEEVSTEFIFYLDLSRIIDMVIDFGACLHKVSRASANSPYARPQNVNVTVPDESSLQRIQTLEHIPNHLQSVVDGLLSHLEESVMRRVQNIPQDPGRRGQARLAVLFSGGIDCTVVAFLAHRHTPLDEPIDLFNVAFENPRKIRAKVHADEKKRRISYTNPSLIDHQHGHSYLVPDRVTGLEELDELRQLCPGRTWNFVEIDVPIEESLSEKSAIEALMFPRRTVMDLSLASALYFASRGVGRVQSDTAGEHPREYASPARVLLSGLGSDELLGGYGRHRTSYRHGGWIAVINELQLELDRIPTRNLGRDDRVISSHGKETRYPFLSLPVVNFLADLPVHYKLDPRLDLGVGDKILLRLAARKLGLSLASGRKKKAMQFGSYSARMEGGESEKKGNFFVS